MLFRFLPPGSLWRGQLQAMDDFWCLFGSLSDAPIHREAARQCLCVRECGVLRCCLNDISRAAVDSSVPLFSGSSPPLFHSRVTATSWLRNIQACFECVWDANTLGERGRRDAGHPPDRRPESLALNLHCRPALSPATDSLSNDRHATYWIRFDSAGRMLYWFTVTTSRLQLTQLCHLCRPRLLSGMPALITTGKYRFQLKKT